MKRFCLVVFLLIFCSFLCACRTVSVSSADELMSRSWYAETAYGLTGELVFQEDTASLTITSSEEKVTISGSLSIDSKNFYITSTDFYRTYTFSYSVFFDRAEITYGENTLVFYPKEDEETSIPN